MTTSSKIPVIIAHRGASGYLPEHTLVSKAMAHALGADFLEQDVVLTRDDVPIVLHDIHLDTVSDVAQRFPLRARSDGRFYAIDFTFAEIGELKVTERFHPETGAAVFPNRFPAGVGRFQIPSLIEELELIRGLNQSTQRVAGIYPEIKQPAFHRREGKDMTRCVLPILNGQGYSQKSDPCYLQCFDQQELRRIREEFGSRLRLIQLLEEETCKEMLSSTPRLQQELTCIAEYADGIGPSLNGVFIKGEPTDLVSAAHGCGLVVHPWTYRQDAFMGGFSTFAELHAASRLIGVDGLFSDFPDLSRKLGQGE